MEGIKSMGEVEAERGGISGGGEFCTSFIGGLQEMLKILPEAQR